MNVSKKTLVMISGLIMLFAGVLGLILCLLPAISTAFADSDSVWSVAFSTDPDAYGNGSSVLLLGIAALLGGIGGGVLQFLVGTGKIPAVPKKVQSLSQEEKKKKIFAGFLLGGVTLSLFYIVAAVLFFCTKRLLGFNETVYKVGAGSIGAGVVCVILALLGVCAEYFGYLYRLDVINNEANQANE